MPLTPFILRETTRILALICQRPRSESRIGMSGLKRYNNEKLIDSMWSTLPSCNGKHSTRV
jgi:hypothetical protein